MSAWDDRRPIFKRLPQYGWQDQDPPVSDWVIEPFDAIAMELQSKILSFPDDYIDPDTCRADALDWLAQLSGYTGEYWDTTWSEAVKRTLIKDAQSTVWNYRGTIYLLQYLINLFGLNQAYIVVPGSWRVGVTAIGSPIGGQLLVYSIVIGTQDTPGYLRNSAEWRLLQRLIKLFMPCWAGTNTLNGSHLHYQRFRVGLSAVGDPI